MKKEMKKVDGTEHGKRYGKIFTGKNDLGITKNTFLIPKDFFLYPPF